MCSNVKSFITRLCKQMRLKMVHNLGRRSRVRSKSAIYFTESG
jgi:hypothetical protein